MSQPALADESEPPGQPGHRSVQIGAAPLVRSTDAFHPRPPLDNRVTLSIPDGTLRGFFEEVSRQTKLEFILVYGVGDCRVGAYLHDVSAREALQLSLLTGKLTYQQLGRSNSYTVVPRHMKNPGCPPMPKLVGAGQCRSGSRPISLECSDGKLSSLVEQLQKQAEGNYLVWNGALDYPVSIKLNKVSLKKALKKLRKNKALDIQQPEKSNTITFTLRAEADPSEQSSVQLSTRAFTITPRGTEESLDSNSTRTKRIEPEANPAFTPGMAN